MESANRDLTFPPILELSKRNSSFKRLLKCGVYFYVDKTIFRVAISFQVRRALMNAKFNGFIFHDGLTSYYCFKSKSFLKINFLKKLINGLKMENREKIEMGSSAVSGSEEIDIN